jgi:hypothetical protein
MFIFLLITLLFSKCTIAQIDGGNFTLGVGNLIFCERTEFKYKICTIIIPEGLNIKNLKV